MSESMNIVVDTEESRCMPYCFPAPTIVEPLPVGHYSIAGFADRVVVVRLTASDLFLACGTRRDEYLAILDRLYGVPSRHVILETTLDGITQNPPADSRMNAKSVRATLIAWTMRYGFALWPFDSREAAAVWCWLILERWVRDREKLEAGEVIGPGTSTYRAARAKIRAHAQHCRQAAAQQGPLSAEALKAWGQ